jgi:hypothetical protein
LLAGIDEAAHAVEHARKRRDPIMHDAPQIEDEAVIMRRQLPHALDQPNRHSAFVLRNTGTQDGGTEVSARPLS